MQIPPTASERTYRRLLGIARGDGWSIVVVAGLSGVTAVLSGAWLATGISALVVLAGVAELHGRRRLLAGDGHGLAWMIRAQLFLLATLWVYVWCRWHFFDPTALWKELPALAQGEIDRQLIAAGLTPEFDRPLLLRMMNGLVCLLVAVLSLFYQGGLALYYALKRRAVTEALASLPPVS